jgi:hypothetical protein
MPFPSIKTAASALSFSVKTARERPNDMNRDTVSEQLRHAIESTANSGLPPETLIEIGNDHRLANPEPLKAMLEACERLTM